MSPYQLARTCLCAVALAALAACGGPSSSSPAPNAAGSTAPANAKADSPPPAAAGSGNAPPPQSASVDDLLGKPAAQPAGVDAAGSNSATPRAGSTTDSAASSMRASAPPPTSAAHDAGVEAGADTQPADVEEGAGYARVVSVTKLAGPRQVCTDERVVERRHPHDHTTATVVGAVVGGVLGNRIGRGRGRTLATVGGAVAGGAVGREVGREHDRRDAVSRVVRHCRPVRNAEEGVELYDVIYAYQGQNLHARLDYDPGDRVKLPVRSVE